MNERQRKPRSQGITEIRGPYYTPLGRRYLTDLLETMGEHVDSLKFAGGSFALMPRATVREMIELAHQHAVLVSTGGFIEYLLTQRPAGVAAYIDECRALGFDTIELSAGFISLPVEDWLRLMERVHEAGLKARPELSLQWGAGGGSRVEDLQAAGSRPADWLILQARRFLDAGASLIMIESEGITENVDSWRTDVLVRIVAELGLERLIFEAADPDVFGWYVENFGAEVNLFVDHSQIVQLEALRRGIWGTTRQWGRVVTFKDKPE
jgi:phosphosulfolactate synthase (CoM biosynthesis protein A)